MLMFSVSQPVAFCAIQSGLRGYRWRNWASMPCNSQDIRIFRGFRSCLRFDNHG